MSDLMCGKSSKIKKDAYASFFNYRRTGNRGQTYLPVGLKVIDNSPLPARYQITLSFNGRVRGSRKPRPLSIADFRLLRTHVVLVQASVSSLHHKNEVSTRRNWGNRQCAAKTHDITFHPDCIDINLILQNLPPASKNSFLLLLLRQYYRPYK